jgi:hypothetical protein
MMGLSESIQDNTIQYTQSQDSGWLVDEDPSDVNPVQSATPDQNGASFF